METTDDGFLGGRLKLLQPKSGYRAGADPVFLAASVPAKPGESVLDLGTGVGTALLCLGSRVPGLTLVGVERQSELADLALENAKRNQIEAEFVAADIMNLPADIKGRSFDHVIANPPFFDRRAGNVASVAGREAGRGEDTHLSDWIDTALKRLGPRGRLHIVQRAERVPALFSAMDSRVGEISLRPLVPRQERAAELVILSARKGARAPFRLLSPVILHDGARHERDGDSYSAVAQAVLRQGAALE